MARTILLEETTLSFEYHEVLGAFACGDANPLFELEAEETYEVVWDGESYTRTAFSFVSVGGAECVGIGNTLAAGQENNGDVFCVLNDKTNNYMYYISLDQQSNHTVAVYQVTEEQEEVGIILKDLNGEDVTYKGVEKVKFNTSDGGTAYFSKGEAVENVPIMLDFSGGDQTIIAPDGTLVKSAIIAKPDTLVPENIVKDVEIAGVVGTNEGGGSGGTETTIGAISKAVNFYNVDGDIVYSYTRAEAAALTELPPVPEFGNLVGTWSRTLEQVKTVQGFLDVGALYEKNGNRTVVAVVANDPLSVVHQFNVTLGASVTLNIYHSPDHVEPDQTQTNGSSETGYAIAINRGDSYSNNLKCYYVFEFVGTNAYKSYIGGKIGSTLTPFFNTKTGTSKSVRSVTCGLMALTTKGISTYQYCLYNDYALSYLCTTGSINHTYNIYNCYNLTTLVTSSDTSISYSNCFNYSYPLKRLRLSSSSRGAPSIAYGFKELLYSGSSTIATSAHTRNLIVLSETPMTATISTDLLQRIYVPDASVDAYKAHTSWSAYSDYIHPLSEYPDY